MARKTEQERARIKMRRAGEQQQQQASNSKVSVTVKMGELALEGLGWWEKERNQVACAASLWKARGSMPHADWTVDPLADAHASAPASAIISASWFRLLGRTPGPQALIADAKKV